VATPLLEAWTTVLMFTLVDAGMFGALPSVCG
jgi:hypothetical protein